jgi:uncharacterized protein (TIGR00369 family)
MNDRDQFEALPPNFSHALISKSQSVHPFWTLLGMELVDIRKGWAIVKLPFDRKLTQADGIAHGGATFSAADAAVAMALIGLIDRSETMVTLEMKLNYIKPFTGGTLMAEAVIVQKGARTAVGEVDLRTGMGEWIAKGMATYMIIEKRPA